MSKLTDKQADLLGLTELERACAVQDPNDENTFLILIPALKKVTVKHAGNMAPTISETEPLNAKEVMKQAVSAGDDYQIGLMASDFGLSKLAFGLRWGRVLAKKLGYIE
jgi:hypothetical protein